MTPTKKKYIEHAIKYISLAIMTSGAVVGVLRVTAAPYIKTEIDKAIQDNNRWLEQQYAGKNELLIKIYESQKETNMRISVINEDVAKIKGKLER